MTVLVASSPGQSQYHHVEFLCMNLLECLHDGAHEAQLGTQIAIDSRNDSKSAAELSPSGECSKVGLYWSLSSVSGR